MKKEKKKRSFLNVTEEVTSSTTGNIATNMMKLNMNLEDISKMTGLSIDELKKELY